MNPPSPGRPRPHLTLVELGRRLELDKSTVSLALRDSPKIAIATRKRVQAFAARHAYRPNLAARQLSGSKPQLVGVVLPDALGSLNTPVVVRSLSLIASLVTGAHMLFNVMPSSVLTFGAASHIPLLPDAAVVWGTAPIAAVEALTARHCPTLVLDPNHPSYAQYTGPTIRIGNRAGAATLTKHLVEAGARRLLFIQVLTDHLAHDQRWEGARASWSRRADPTGLTRIPLGDLDDRQLVAFAGAGQGAILCSNDQGALQVWHRLNRLGIAVPGHVLLAGFDGDEYGGAHPIDDSGLRRRSRRPHGLPSDREHDQSASVSGCREHPHCAHPAPRQDLLTPTPRRAGGRFTCRADPLSARPGRCHRRHYLIWWDFSRR